MADVFQRALDPRVPPRRILLRHPHDEPPNLQQDTATTAPSGVGPLPRDELPMPSHDRVRCDDARDLMQGLPTQPMPTDRQLASIVIGEPEALATQLASKDPIFFY